MTPQQCLEAYYSPARRPGLQDTHRQFLTAYVQQCKDDDRLLQTSDAAEALCSSFDGLAVSPKSVRKHFKDSGLTYQKVQKVVEPQMFEGEAGMRRQWFEDMRAKKVNYFYNCVFIDEGSINENVRSSKAWAMANEPPVVVNPDPDSAITYTAAVSYHGLEQVSVKIYETAHEVLAWSSDEQTDFLVQHLKDEPCGATSDQFVRFLWALMESTRDKLRPGESIFLVLNNARQHKTEDVQRMVPLFNKIFDTKFEIFYLPPNSPQLNPARSFLEVFKEKFRATEEGNALYKRARSAISGSNDLEMIRQLVERSAGFSEKAKSGKDLSPKRSPKRPEGSPTPCESPSKPSAEALQTTSPLSLQTTLDQCSPRTRRVLSLT